MSKSLQIETSPRWYQIPHGVFMVLWILAVLGGAVQLYRQLKMASLLPSVFGMGYKVGAISSYLAFVVCLIFTWRFARALSKSSRGSLKIESVAMSTKVISILACIGSIAIVAIIVRAKQRGELVDDDETSHLVFTIIMGAAAAWILFLTARIAFGKTEAATGNGETT